MPLNYITKCCALFIHIFELLDLKFGMIFSVEKKVSKDKAILVIGSAGL
jgi:hypothetical protein